MSSDGRGKQTASRGVGNGYLLGNGLQTVVAEVQQFQRGDRKARNPLDGVKDVVIQKEHLRLRNVLVRDVVANELNRAFQLGSSLP